MRFVSFRPRYRPTHRYDVNFLVSSPLNGLCGGLGRGAAAIGLWISTVIELGDTEGHSGKRLGYEASHHSAVAGG